jgi:hypothetical protein
MAWGQQTAKSGLFRLRHLLPWNPKSPHVLHSVEQQRRLPGFFGSVFSESSPSEQRREEDDPCAKQPCVQATTATQRRIVAQEGWQRRRIIERVSPAAPPRSPRGDADVVIMIE